MVGSDQISNALADHLIWSITYTVCDLCSTVDLYYMTQIIIGQPAVALNVAVDSIGQNARIVAGSLNLQFQLLGPLIQGNFAVCPLTVNGSKLFAGLIMIFTIHPILHWFYIVG